MYYIISQSGQVSYGIKEFIADFVTDLDNIKNEMPGSKAYVVENNTYYFLSPQGEWVVEEGDGVRVPAPSGTQGKVLASGASEGDGWHEADLIAAGDKVFATSPEADFSISYSTDSQPHVIRTYDKDEADTVVVPKLTSSTSRGTPYVCQLGVPYVWYWYKKRGVFDGCLAHTYVLPSYLTGDIPEYCFANSNIQHLFILSHTLVKVDETAFEGAVFTTDPYVDTLYVYVPARLLDNYMADETWQKIEKAIFVAIDEEDSKIWEQLKEDQQELVSQAAQFDSYKNEMSERLTNLKDRDIGIYTDLSTQDFGVLAATATTNNCVEVSLCMINNAKVTFEHHSATLYSWGIDVSNYCLTDGLTFRVPVSMNISQGNIILYLSQLETLNGYTYAGIGKAIIRTIV